MRSRVAIGCAVALWATAACLSAAPAKDTPKKPNVIVIVSDDQGYADLEVQGAKDIRTPNIDKLAANGCRFTNGYVAAPLCSPSRAGLLTGRHQQRFGHEFNPGPDAAANFGLPTTEKTIANYMKEAGYVTGMVGKWHQGNRDGLRPPQRGFDEFFGFLGGAHSYMPIREEKPMNKVRRGDEEVTETRYLTYAFNDEAVAFIERHKKDPFFLYLAYNAIHTPMQEAPGKGDQFKGIKDEKRRTMATMLAALDEGVGRVVKSLEQNKLDDNTLIFYIADNGGPTAGNGSRNDPLSGFKGQVLEGGIRVPFLVQWKGVLPKGLVYDKPVISLDILPTAVAAAGTSVTVDSKVEGVNLLPFLKGEEKGAPHGNLFWRMGRQWAVRSGDWKLVQQAGDAQPRLYNLATDVGEKTDVAGANAGKVRELQTTYDAWNAKNVAPLWRDSRDAKRAKAGKPEGKQLDKTGKKAGKKADKAGRKAGGKGGKKANRKSKADKQPAAQPES